MARVVLFDVNVLNIGNDSLSQLMKNKRNEKLCLFFRNRAVFFKLFGDLSYVKSDVVGKRKLERYRLFVASGKSSVTQRYW